jgi:hypothetical protein
MTIAEKKRIHEQFWKIFLILYGLVAAVRKGTDGQVARFRVDEARRERG